MVMLQGLRKTLKSDMKNLQVGDKKGMNEEGGEALTRRMQSCVMKVLRPTSLVRAESRRSERCETKFSRGGGQKIPKVPSRFPNNTWLISKL